jgi:dienelactone hydrolase
MIPAARLHAQSKWIMCALLCILLLFASSIGYSQVARMEVYSFPSVTLTDTQFLAGEKGGKPVTLSGELRLPKPSGRQPLVILVHGSGGIAGYVTDWEQEFNAMGVATFIFDSFTPRGIDNTREDQAQLGRLNMIFDAYRALELLAKNPRIDSTRIAVMGFSRGGQAALYASMKRFQKMYGPANLELAAYIPFYPDCSTTFKNDTEVADRPIRIFHGVADDWAPVAPCLAYVERLKAKNKDVQLTAYPGASHTFDWQAVKKPVRLEKAQTVRNCQLAEADDGVIINTKTRGPFTYNDPCVERGTTIAYDEKASIAARKAVKEFVTATLKP